MKFRILGADRETGEDVEIIVEARDEVAAETIAGRRNIMVSDVALVRLNLPRAEQRGPIASKTSLKCVECGNEVNSGAVTCPYCGALTSAEANRVVSPETSRVVEALGQLMHSPGRPSRAVDAEGSEDWTQVSGTPARVVEPGSTSSAIVGAAVFLGVIAICAGICTNGFDFGNQSSRASGTGARNAEQVEAESSLARHVRVSREPQPKSSATPSGSYSSSARQWYQGGTLHDKTALEWQTASSADKLATCGDFVANMWQSDNLRPSIANNLTTVDDVRPYALELVVLLDAAFKPHPDPVLNRKMYTNQTVAEFAATEMVLMGWTK